MPFNMEKRANIAIPKKNFLWTLPSNLRHFKWNVHIDKIRRKANEVFQMIKRNVTLFRQVRN